MEHIYMRIPERKWSIDLKTFVKFMYRHVPTWDLRSYATGTGDEKLTSEWVITVLTPNQQFLLYRGENKLHSIRW
jgi:hypothetical protein